MAAVIHIYLSFFLSVPVIDSSISLSTAEMRYHSLSTESQYGLYICSQATVPHLTRFNLFHDQGIHSFKKFKKQPIKRYNNLPT